MLYLTVFVILVLLSYEFDFCKKTRKWKLWYYFILFTLILIAGLRYRLGNDTINYMNWFAKLPTFSNYKINFGDYEIGFVLLSVLVKSIGGGFYLLQIVVAAIFNISFFSFIKTSRTLSISSFAFSFVKNAAVSTTFEYAFIKA